MHLEILSRLVQQISTAPSFLHRISSKPRKSLEIIKKLVNSEISQKKGITLERKEFYNLLDSENKIIGIESFLSKIKPNWK